MKLQHQILTAFLVGTSLASGATTSTTTESKTGAEATAVAGQSVSEQVDPIIKEFTDKYHDVLKRMRMERDRNKQREIYKEMPNGTKTVAKVLAIVKLDLKAEGVEEALAWAVTAGSDEQSKEIKSILLESYPEGEGLLGYVKSLARSYAPNVLDELRELIKGSKNEKVKQTASYYLATKLLEPRHKVSAEKLAANKKEGMALLKEMEKDPQLKESNPKLFKTIESKLFVAENLSIGCEAPDIVGADHAGEEFKLSDYRGKVVLLDFWGIW